MVSEHTESKYAQDVRGTTEGPVMGSEALPQFDYAMYVVVFNAIQGSFTNLEEVIGRQSTVNNPPDAPITTIAQLAPYAPPSPLPPREWTMRDQC